MSPSPSLLSKRKRVTSPPGSNPSETLTPVDVATLLPHPDKRAARTRCHAFACGTSVLVGVLLGSTACTDADEGGFDPPPDPPLIQAVEVWAAGGIEEEGGLVVASAGRPFAAISRDLHVLFVEPEAAGAILLTPEGEIRSGIGREGEGPGEFQRPWAGGFLDDTAVWILDSALERVTVYDRDGAVRSSRRVSAEGLPGTPWTAHPWMLLEGGGLLGRPVSSGAPGSAAGVPAPIALWDHAGTLKVAGLTEPTAVPRGAGDPISADGDRSRHQGRATDRDPSLGGAHVDLRAATRSDLRGRGGPGGQGPRPLSPRSGGLRR